MRKPWHVFIAGILVAAMAGCSLSTWMPDRIERLLEDESRTGIPVVRDEGLALVPVSIGEEGPFLFVFDTGASMSVISPSLRSELGFQETDGRQLQITGASGDEQFQSLELEAVDVMGHRVEDLEVVVINIEPYEHSDLPYAGILGQDFLQQFDFVYDLPGGELILYPHRDEEPPHIPGADTLMRVPFHEGEPGRGFIRLDLVIGEAEGEAILDTGSRYTVLNWEAALQDGAVEEDGPYRDVTFGIGAEAPTETYVYTFESIAADSIRFTPREVSVADLPVFQMLAMEQRAGMLLGNDLLEDRLVVIRYSTREVLFSQPRLREEG